MHLYVALLSLFGNKQLRTDIDSVFLIPLAVIALHLRWEFNSALGIMEMDPLDNYKCHLQVSLNWNMPVAKFTSLKGFVAR